MFLNDVIIHACQNRSVSRSGYTQLTALWGFSFQLFKSCCCVISIMVQTVLSVCVKMISVNVFIEEGAWNMLYCEGTNVDFTLL